MSAMILMSDEANNEIKEFLDKPASVIGAGGKVTFKVDDARLIKFCLYYTSHYPL